jgi:uncharacterized membrane protein
VWSRHSRSTSFELDHCLAWRECALATKVGEHERQQSDSLSRLFLPWNHRRVALATAPALVSWAAHLGWLDLSDSRLSFLGSRAAIITLSLLALAELVADKLPKTPKRTDLGPLVFRAITGGFSSMAICASAHQSTVIGTILGILGSIAGAFAGYEIRHRLVEAFGLPDFGVALAEDIVAIGGGLLIVSQPPDSIFLACCGPRQDSSE